MKQFSRVTWISVPLAAALACDGETTVSPPPIIEVVPPPINVSLQWEQPFPQGNDLFRMCGFDDGSFYAVGEAGTVIRHHAGTIDVIDIPAREDLHGAWAHSPDDVYVCGFEGTLVHFDGIGWRALETPTNENFYGVWGTSGSDLFLASSAGSVWNVRHGEWTRHAVAPDSRLRAIWGYSHDEVYTAGSRAALFRFDGEAWNRMLIHDDPDIETEIYDLWGPSPGTISMLDRYAVVWFDGQRWGAHSIVTGNGFGLWGFALDKQIAVSDGLNIHLGGEQPWYDSSTLEPLFDAWGRSMTDCFAVGRSGSVAHFDGAAWSAMGREFLNNLNDVFVSPFTALAVGANGAILRQQGGEWLAESVDSRYELAAAWEAPGLAIAVGRYAPDGVDWRQAILMNTASAWTDVGAVGTAHRLFDVWGSSSSDVYAVGWAGEMLHYDGNVWSVVANDFLDAAYLSSVSGTATDNVFAVGRTNGAEGLACWFDGVTWKTSQLNGVSELRAVWTDGRGSAFAVGSSGAIRRFANSRWFSMPSPTKAELLCVTGSSPSDVYAAGSNGTFVHYDGHAWRELRPATNRAIRSISIRSASEVFLAGERGAIWRFDGSLSAVARR